MSKEIEETAEKSYFEIRIPKKLVKGVVIGGLALAAIPTIVVIARSGGHAAIETVTETAGELTETVLGTEA